MPNLSFQVESADMLPYAATPCLAFKLRITNAIPDERIQSIALNCQIRIEPAKRSYQPGEQQRLGDLFGTPERWGQSLRPLLWAHCQTQFRRHSHWREIPVVVLTALELTRDERDRLNARVVQFYRKGGRPAH